MRNKSCVFVNCCSFSGIQKLKILQIKVTIFILSQVSTKTISVFLLLILNVAHLVVNYISI